MLFFPYSPAAFHLKWSKLYIYQKPQSAAQSKMFQKHVKDLEKGSVGYWEQSMETKDISSASQEVVGCIRALLAAVIWNLL